MEGRGVGTVGLDFPENRTTEICLAMHDGLCCQGAAIGAIAAEEKPEQTGFLSICAMWPRDLDSLTPRRGAAVV